MQIESILLDRLQAHPYNSNVMSSAAFETLKAHIERTDQYPPIVVRPPPESPESPEASATPGTGTAPGESDRHQILDGHHRVQALRQLGYREACCVVWPVDDEQALTLLATLNRLEGKDDPHKRASLLEALEQRLEPEALAQKLPESPSQLKRMIEANHAPPTPQPPPAPATMPEAMHFFFTPAVRRQVDAALRRVDGDRHRALLKALDIDGDL